MKQTQTIWSTLIFKDSLCHPVFTWIKPPLTAKHVPNIIDQFKSPCFKANRNIQSSTEVFIASPSLVSRVDIYLTRFKTRRYYGEFVGENYRYTMFTGFYYWLLISSPGSGCINDSMVELASKASGFPKVTELPASFRYGLQGLLPNYWSRFCSGIAVGIVSGILSIGLLIIFALIASKHADWVMCCLEPVIRRMFFGLRRWALDIRHIAINYYKSCLSIGTGLSNDPDTWHRWSFLSGYVTNMSHRHLSEWAGCHADYRNPLFTSSSIGFRQWYPEL